MIEVGTSNVLLLMVKRESEVNAPTAEDVQEDAATINVALIEAARGGDERAFGNLYKLYAPMVHGILLARVPYSEVGDLVQDVFLTAFTKLPKLREVRAFGAWLAMIARNRAMDFHRHKRETEELSTQHAEQLVSHDSPCAEAVEVLDTIRALPEAYRETLVLRLVEGMTGPEIAARTGLQTDSVRVNLHRGMKLLRERLNIAQ